MHLGLNLSVFGNCPLEKAVRAAARAGVEAVELPVHKGSPFLDLESSFDSWVPAFRELLTELDLRLSAVDNHLDSQLMLGPYGQETAFLHPGSDEERKEWATTRMERTFALAEALGVSLVTGFFGEAPGSHWFAWPDSGSRGRALDHLIRTWRPLLDSAAEHGLRFAHEPHPRQTASDLESCRRLLDDFGEHPAFGINLDVANLWLSRSDPACFVREMGEHVRHVHLKDVEFPQEATREARYRFRIPGWGELDWRGILSALQAQGYRGTLSLEHEDPLLGRDDGIAKAIAYLRPLIPLADPPEPWW